MNNDKNIGIKGGLWTSLSTAVTIVASFARVMILTRFLEKSDFGVVSIINMVIALCMTFTDLGFASVIMYRQKLTDREFSSLYWSQLFLFSIIYVILWLLSPYISTFYKESILSSLIPLASLSIICQAIGKLYDSVLQKRYQFRLLAFRNIVSNFVSLLLAGWMAWKGWGVYSLVYSTLCQAIILNVWNFFSGYKIQKVRFQFAFQEIIPLIKIGLFQTGTRILDFFAGKLDVMIIGKLLGTEMLGIYDLAKELVFKLVDFIRTIVSKVALPIISNNNDNDEAVRSKFLIITKTVSTLCIPLCIAVALFSKDIVHLVYGEKYSDMYLLVSIFAVITIITSISSFFDMLGVAKGRTDLNFKYTFYRVLVTTPVIFLCSHYSLIILALGQLFVTIIMVMVFWRVVVKETYPMSVHLYLSQFQSLLYACSLAAFITILLRNINLFPPHFNWILLAILYGIVYLSIMGLNFKIFKVNNVSLFISILHRK